MQAAPVLAGPVFQGRNTIPFLQKASNEKHSSDF